MDVQTVNRKQLTNTHKHRTADRHIFCSVCCDIYWEATAPLTSPIDRPALPLRLTGMSTGRVCVFKRQYVVSLSVYGLIPLSECVFIVKCEL